MSHPVHISINPAARTICNVSIQHARDSFWLDSLKRLESLKPLVNTLWELTYDKLLAICTVSGISTYPIRTYLYSYIVMSTQVVAVSSVISWYSILFDFNSNKKMNKDRLPQSFQAKVCWCNVHLFIDIMFISLVDIVIPSGYWCLCCTVSSRITAWL